MPMNSTSSTSSGESLFRIRQILDNVEARPVARITSEPQSLNSYASKSY